MKCSEKRRGYENYTGLSSGISPKGGNGKPDKHKDNLILNNEIVDVERIQINDTIK